LVPAFGDLFVDQLRPTYVMGWQARVAAKIKTGNMAPTTAKTILGVLRQITDEAGTFESSSPGCSWNRAKPPTRDGRR
jgi:hypothetical protein